MSQDQFKKYVEDNRSEFESYQGDFQDMWGNIEQSLDTRQQHKWPVWTKIAATVLMMVIAGWVTLKFKDSKGLPLEIYETEQHYSSIINVKLEQIQMHHEVVDASIWEDLKLLDLAYEDLKKDLKEQVDQEEVAQAMIENQRSKLEILEKVLDEIESKADDNIEVLDI